MRLRTHRLSSMKKNTRVLMRVDTNVPIKNGRVIDGSRGRLAHVAPEIERYAKRGARVIVLSHLGRPKGKRVKALSNRPIAKKMGKMLGRQVEFVSSVSGPVARRAVGKMSDGDILWLENVRFEEGEKKNSSALAKAWAASADLYINNAFGACHRKHASVHAITRELPSYAGSLIQKEVSELSKPFRKPFVIVVGGIKIKTKLPALSKLAPQADMILVGGTVALTLAGAALHKPLHPAGLTIEPDEYKIARTFLKRFIHKV